MISASASRLPRHATSVPPSESSGAAYSTTTSSGASARAVTRSKAALVATRGSVRFQLQLAAAQGAQQAVRYEFEKLKKSGEERWNALAAGLEVAWKDLTA